MANFTLIGLILIEIAAFLHMVSLVSPYWLIDWSEQMQFSVRGLWSRCTTYLYADSSSSSCSSSALGDAFDGWVFTVRAFAILAMIALVCALFVVMLNWFEFEGKKIWTTLAMKACFFAAWCLFLAVVITGANSRIKTTLNFHFAFAFEVLSFLVSVAAGVVNVLDMRSVPEKVQSQNNPVKFVNNHESPEQEDVKFVETQ